MKRTTQLAAAIGIALVCTTIAQADDRRGQRNDGWRAGYSYNDKPKRSARYRGSRRFDVDRGWRRGYRAGRRDVRGRARSGNFRSIRRGRAIDVWIDGNRFRFREPRRCR
ncbi:MAG: hypothetical protein ACR2QV_08350 [Gammaproteobacteria bacterium]